MTRLFDLNIEQVLEHWDPAHAVREIIANALDEQILTHTKKIQIYKSGKTWCIRDFGRGLQSTHFTQNENLNSPFLIGKFGVGLKDALAVFYRHGIDVEINSKYGRITLVMADKKGFDIKTLHAAFNDPVDRNFVGTKFMLRGISDESIEQAKKLFLCFNHDLVLLEKTKYGEVYQTAESSSAIYINGVCVATEDNFLFSYNITNIGMQIKRALNRERNNISRTAYADTIKKILTRCQSDDVLFPLIKDLILFTAGNNHDESSWIDVATYAALVLGKEDSYVFMTPAQRAVLPNYHVEILERSGKTLILVTDAVYDKIADSVQTFQNVLTDHINSYEFEFVSIEDLTQQEQQVFSLVEPVKTFLKKHGLRHEVDVKIAKKICSDQSDFITLGLCSSSQNAIIILRSILQDPVTFCSTLLHEFAHYQAGHPDNTRAFENDLSVMLGVLFIDYNEKS